MNYLFLSHESSTLRSTTAPCPCHENNVVVPPASCSTTTITTKTPPLHTTTITTKTRLGIGVGTIFIPLSYLLPLNLLLTQSCTLAPPWLLMNHTKVFIRMHLTQTFGSVGLRSDGVSRQTQRRWRISLTKIIVKCGLQDYMTKPPPSCCSTHFAGAPG